MSALGKRRFPSNQQVQDVPMIEFVKGIVAHRNLSDQLSSYLVREVVEIARMCLENERGMKAHNLDDDWNETKEELLPSVCHDCGITLEKHSGSGEKGFGWRPFTGAKFSNPQSERNAIEKMPDSVKQISQKYEQQIERTMRQVESLQEELKYLLADHDKFRAKIQV